jgi:short-subunit dehydrogenase
MNDTRELKLRYGTWALVTGATSGIGEALVRQLASGGMNVVTVARTRKALEAQAEALRSEMRVEVRPVAADLSSDAGTQAVIEAAGDLEIGVLIPCAALEAHGVFVDAPLAGHRALLQTNVVGPMVLAHHFGSKMAKRGRGAILFVSSVSGWNAQPYMANYGAAKAYLISLGEALSLELKDNGVDVSVLSPGPTQTPMLAATGIDVASMGVAIMQPEPVAAAGLATLGRRPHAIPGLSNRLMVFFMTRVLPRSVVGWFSKRMLGKALKIGASSLGADSSSAKPSSDVRREPIAGHEDSLS